MSLETQLRERITRGLAGRIQDEMHKLASGQAASFDQYKQTVGKIQGLRGALDVVDDVFKEILNDEGES